MALALGDMTDFQFDFDSMNLDPNAFADFTQLDYSFEFPIDSMFGFDASFDGPANATQAQNGKGAFFPGSTNLGPVSSPGFDQLPMPQMQPSEPIWTPITPKIATLRQLPAIPFGWKPCSPPLLPVAQPQLEPSEWRPYSPAHTPNLMHAVQGMPLEQFQYPDPEFHLVSQSVPYLSLPPRSVPAQNSVSQLGLTDHQTHSPTDLTAVPMRGLKRRRSIHLEDLYTSDQGSIFYDSDSDLSSAPPSPFTPIPSSFTRSGAKKGRKYMLEQTKERQAANERRRAYYHRVKQDPSRKARKSAKKHDNASSGLPTEPVKKGPKFRLEQTKERQAFNERHKARYHNRHKHDPAWKARQNVLERERYHKRQATKLDSAVEATQAVNPMKVLPETATTTPEETRATTHNSKSKWKGWVVLSDEEEEPSKQDVEASLPKTKKRKLAKEIEDTKEFRQSRAQVEESDSDDDVEEDDDEQYRILPMGQSRRRAEDRENWVRRSRRAKQPVSYAERWV